MDDTQTTVLPPDRDTNLTDIVAPMELQLTYTLLEILVAVVAVVGNAMVIIVFQRERRLRRRTNYYIVSLAVADFLVGMFGIPFAIMASMGMPQHLHACLFTVSLLVVLCTISIFCLVAVSVDRYWAILHPMGYSRNVRTKTAIVIISMCWVAGLLVGFLPLLGWHGVSDTTVLQCYFVRVMDYNYLVFLYFATIITPSVLLAGFYAHIYQVIIKQMRQVVTINPRQGGGAGGTMLRVLGAAQKREVKATQNLSIIVLFFMICWIPLYTINCIKAFRQNFNIHPTVTEFCIILSHLNSAVNPLLYAYHLKDFRAALKTLICPASWSKKAHALDVCYKPSHLSHRRTSGLELASSVRRDRPRIYVDSPVWLRQRAAAAAAERVMWDIAEAQSGSENLQVSAERRGYTVEASSGRRSPEGAPATSSSESLPVPAPPGCAWTQTSDARDRCQYLDLHGFSLDVS